MKREKIEAALGGPEGLRRALVEALRQGGTYRRACRLFNARLPRDLRVSVPTFIAWCWRAGVSLEPRVVVRGG